MLATTFGDHVRRSTLTLLGLLLLAVSLMAAFQGAPYGGPIPAALFAATGLGVLQILSIGRLPNLRELLLDAAVTGLLAFARDGGAALWSVPGNFGDLWRLTPLGVELAILLYFSSAVSVRLRARRHIALFEVLPVIAAPLLFNLVLALGSDGFMRQIGGAVSAGLGGGDVHLGIGRIATLWGFGEILAATLGLAIRGRPSFDVRLHGLFLFCAAHAVLTPLIADLPQMASLPAAQFVLGCAAAALSQAGLWAIVFVFTGLVIEALHRKPPTFEACRNLWQSGFSKGAIYGGVFVFCVLAAGAVLRTPALVHLAAVNSLLVAAVAGTLLFPLIATIVGSADGTAPFFGRLVASYRDPRAYGRGLVLGLGVTLALTSDLRNTGGFTRFIALFAVGALTYAGTDIAFDLAAILRGKRRKLQTWRVYAMGVVLGGLVGGALGWYFDAAQIGVVADRFWAYADIDYHSSGRSISNFVNNTLFSKWASVDLGTVGGGVRLFYAQSLSGVINWSIAAPLFSINYFLLDALLQKNLGPVRKLFSREGVESLVEQAVRVMRWGLWMAPVIDSFLRMAPDPSWYNQDGAVRTVVATIADAILPAGDFRVWSIAVFTGILAYDWLRILVWFDHMGLRVATLVNLTFLGGDRADEHAARFVGYPARTRVIPDGIRRFMTWAPLLIPFYIPRGGEWDQAWDGADRIRATAPPLLAPVFLVLIAYGVALCFAAYVAWRIALRWGHSLPASTAPKADAPASLALKPEHFALSNGLMGLTLTRDGRGYVHLDASARQSMAIDLIRRPTDRLQARGPFFYLRDANDGEIWSVGYEPTHKTGTDYAMSQPRQACIRLVNTFAEIAAEAEASLADHDCLQAWRVRLTNRGNAPRRIVLSSFQELALHEPGAYTRDSDFANMHVETFFVAPLNAIFARNRLLRDHARSQAERRMSKEMAFHAVLPGEGTKLLGYEDSRTRFIGGGELAKPQGLEPGRPRSLDDEGKLATFDPAASLHVEVDLPPGASREVTFVLGHAMNAMAAARLAARAVDRPVPAEAALRALFERNRELEPLPALPPETWPFAFSPSGADLILTQNTPRPWAHVLANSLGYGAVVSNEGEIHSFAGNERQNALSPYSFESVATTLPGQLVYVVDLDTGEVDAPSHVPFRRADSDYQVVYDLGSATFRKRRGDTELELTAFVLPDTPADIRLLTIRNRSNAPKRYRVVPYIDLALDESPAASRGAIQTWRDAATETLLFANWGNDFRKGVAFAATSLKGAAHETVRSRFFGGVGRGFENPVMVETGEPDPSRHADGRRVAAFAGVVDVPPHGETEVSVILGQRANHGDAIVTAAQFDHPAAATAALAATRAWWANYLGAIEITTNHPEFDRLVNHWLPYQLLASRLWGRTGPNQRGGATGYRDQLQDVLPLVFFDPDLTRRQIVLHAGQQFPEGDVLKWWHAAPHGGTGLGQRTTAADPHLWLPYVLVRYLAATGDRTVLDEMATYLEGPHVPPGSDTITFVPRPSRESGTVYEHCVRAIDHALSRRGAHGLPLLGGGDWNDGLDLAGLREAGESVWMAFFLHDILTGFAPIAAAREGEAAGARYRAEASAMATALENAWLGDHYALVFHDSGVPMDPASAMTSAWPILSGAVGFERGHAALEQGLSQLEQADRILLLSPPYTENSLPYPGRIADYPPGVRENGGQYTHGVSWTVDAYMRLAALATARGDDELAAQMRARAFECWVKISPIGKTEGDQLAVYGLAPNQQPADIYEGPAHAGRGGWSWYTGSAARMLSAAYAILGIEMRDGVAQISEEAFEPKGSLLVERIRIRGKEFVAPAEREEPAKAPAARGRARTG